MSRSLLDLDPAVQGRFGEFLRLCAAKGVAVAVYCTRRSLSEQAALYEQGRTTPGPIVTMAPPGRSWHNWGRAIDCAPFDRGPSGSESKLDWTPFVADGQLDPEDWKIMVAAAKSIGIEWAGDWTGKFREYVHFQITDGMTLDQISGATRA